MAKPLHKKHGTFFRSLMMLMFLFVLLLMGVLTYYVINATTSTSTRASYSDPCMRFKTKSLCQRINTCYWDAGGVCLRLNVSQSCSGLNKQACGQNSQNCQWLNGSCNYKRVAGNYAVSDNSGYCNKNLDCNISGQQPKGSSLCRSPLNHDLLMYCCPFGTHRDKTLGEPGNCVKN